MEEPKTFLMVSDEPAEGEERYEFLIYGRNATYFDSVRPALDSEITLRAIHEYLDNDAEHRNYHSFAGVHYELAQMMVTEVGEESTLAVFKKLAIKGGLHNFDTGD